MSSPGHDRAGEGWDEGGSGGTGYAAIPRIRSRRWDGPLMLPIEEALVATSASPELIALLRSDSNAANAFGALASALAAVLALFVSCASVWIAISAARSQRTHNELSVRPLAEVTVADYESSLRVKLRNNGTGPMIVLAVTVSDGAKALDSLIEWMPPCLGIGHGIPFRTHCVVAPCSPGPSLFCSNSRSTPAKTTFHSAGIESGERLRL